MEPQDPSAAWAVGGSHMRASDADRERVIDALKTAFVQGRLNQSELTERTGHALQSRTYGELVVATAGIPARRTPTPPRPRPAAPARTNQTSGKAIAWAVSLAILLPGAGIAFFDTTYGSFIILLLLGFVASAAIGSPTYPSDARHRAY